MTTRRLHGSDKATRVRSTRRGKFFSKAKKKKFPALAPKTSGSCERRGFIGGVAETI